ncbi:MAG TPA: acyl-CoA dehydrogenase family protein [Mycobacterium sp.]|nr:acyl-CoA dehydrogenase family protein [Mycobacterium sp.]
MNQHDNTTMVESQRPQHVSDRNGRNGHAESPALAADYLNIDSLFTPDEGALRLRVRKFVDERVKPHIADWYENAHFPTELVAELGQIGLLGMAIEGYGCPGRSYVEYGLANMELEAGDSGLRTFVSVQSSLAMSAIYKFGSEAQKNQWLPGMAKGQLIGCFGLTEPDAGSDPAGMQTIARRDGEQWTISGTKRWIGLASIADVAVIWAKTDEGVRGFLVPTSAPGFTATPIQPKLAMRASIQCEIHLDNVRLTEADRLPLATGLTAPLTCLDEARYGILWGVVGAARDSYQVALDYTLNRHQFNRPIASFQIAQQKLVNMVLEINKGLLVALHTGRLKDAGMLRPEQISFGKLNNVRMAIDIAREARTMLGGNGITLDYSPMRHANNLEAVRTYEGTDEIHTLIIGRAITDLPAFDSGTVARRGGHVT